MRNIFKIYTNDLKSVGTNWVAAIVIGGLIILPSLYAWMNIIASWDPYGQTDQIPVAVVNEDVGATVRNEDIHVGNNLVNTLKDNDSFDWQFVSQEKALDKLNYGDYYAVIVIPENFSESLGTVISDHPVKAHVKYYVNEKINAIAPKITEKGASILVEQISSHFISTVNGIIFEIFNEIGIELKGNKPDIEKFEEYIFTLEDNLPDIHDILNGTLADANSAIELINRAQDLIPKVEDAATKGLNTIDKTTDLLQKAKDRLDEIAPKVKENLETIQGIISNLNNYFNNEEPNVDVSEGLPSGQALNGRINDLMTSIDNVQDALNQVPQSENGMGNDQPTQEGEQSGDNPSNNNINNSIKNLDRIKENLSSLQEQLEELDPSLNDKQTEIDEIIARLGEKTSQINIQIDEFINEYKENIEPVIRGEVAHAKQTLTNARDILVNVQSTIPEVKDMLSRTENNLLTGKDTIEDVLGEFPYVNNKVNEIANRIRDIQNETDLNEIIDLLVNDPEKERSFFAEPVVLDENKVFPIENYGTGMTPFYTVLAIWVGGLLLISLLSTELHQPNSYTLKESHFGRLLTFISIGLMQTLIVTVGNIFLINVSVKHPFWFVVFGLFCSLVFVLIIYNFVSVFGDVGKALVIILLVLQIAGAGGTYPIVLLPEFFQMISPFLPFTYAIDLMREAVGGIVWGRVAHDLVYLLLFGTIAFIFGGFLKQLINKYTSKLKEKSQQSGLFH
ncbi:YhgE/Pip family protein [Bacillaceae bacterium W0354]